MEREQDRVHVPGSPTRCPWCKGDIEDVKQVVACAACGARHHGSCHSENGRCATCGSTDVLVPRATPASVARLRREAPPEGSVIEVEHEGEALVYMWPLADNGALIIGIMCALSCVLSPIGLWLLYCYFKDPKARMRVGKGEIEFAGSLGSNPFGKPVRVKKSEVGAVRVTSLQGGSALTIDVGMNRWFVKAGLLGQRLRPPEMEWLAQALEAWKNEP